MGNRPTCDGEMLAFVLGLSIARVSQLKTAGILRTKEGSREYDLAESVQAYMRFKSGGDDRKKKEDAEVAYKSAKARQEQIKLAELEGRMFAAEDVETVQRAAAQHLRAAALAVPGRCAVDMAGKSAEEASAIVRHEIDVMLEGMAAFRYDAKEYKAAASKRKG